MTNALSLSRQRFVSVLVIAVATLLAWPSPARAQLKVIISGGFSTAFRQVLPEFERSTGITVTTLSGASQGTGPETIAAQLSRGVPADVAILSREGLAELIAAGRIAAGTDVDLARAALGAAVRSGAHKPDISTVEALKQAFVSVEETDRVPGLRSCCRGDQGQRNGAGRETLTGPSLCGSHQQGDTAQTLMSPYDAYLANLDPWPRRVRRAMAVRA